MGYNKNKPIDKPSPDDLTKIIAGEPVVSARLTNEWGEKLGSALAKDLASAQIRNIFGMVRQIEMNWMQGSDEGAARRSMILLKPKLRYQAERKNEVRDLAEVLGGAIDLVDRDGDNLSAREKYERFVEFFEAILAYHKAAGGK